MGESLMKRRLALLSILAAAAAASFAPPVHAQDQWAQQIQQLFDKANDQMQSNGYHVDSPIHMGTLKASTSERITLHVTGGGKTQIMGICDTDCSNIDLILYDNAGNVLSKDLEADDVPIVEREGGAADLQLEVRMVKCTTDPCRYGVRAYTNGGAQTVAQSSSTSSSGGIEISALAGRPLPILRAGQQVDGTLTPNSILRSDDTYMNGYYYDGLAGEQIIVTLRSADFDSWLVIDQPDGPFRKWDDDSGGGQDSKLAVTLPATARYIIAANAVGKHATGRYTLRVDKGN
jgi:type II secretory pathway pseudopilin PulG